jgi:hypothetical protein
MAAGSRQAGQTDEGASIRDLLKPVIDQLTRSGKLRDYDESQLADIDDRDSYVCTGCGAKYDLLPPVPPCPYAAHDVYFRGVGMLAGAGVKHAEPESDKRGTDVMIKIQVSDPGLEIAKTEIDDVTL